MFVMCHTLHVHIYCQSITNVSIIIIIIIWISLKIAEGIFLDAVKSWIKSFISLITITFYVRENDAFVEIQPRQISLQVNLLSQRLFYYCVIFFTFKNKCHLPS